MGIDRAIAARQQMLLKCGGARPSGSHSASHPNPAAAHLPPCSRLRREHSTVSLLMPAATVQPWPGAILQAAGVCMRGGSMAVRKRRDNASCSFIPHLFGMNQAQSREPKHCHSWHHAGYMTRYMHST